LSYKQATTEELVKMQQLALTIVLTSQGIPFLHAGTEFLRNKKGVENSYNAGDSINQIDWGMKSKHIAVNGYIQTLIGFRKAHPAFRLTTNQQIKKFIRFDDAAPAGTIVYTINGAAVKDSWKKILIAFNGSNEVKPIKLPAGNWRNAFIKIDVTPVLFSGKVMMEPFSSFIYYQN
jgi:pullulanase